MAQALKRIEKELKYFNGDDCEEGYTAGPVDESDMFHWTASFPGTENSPYEGGTFQLKIEFPKDLILFHRTTPQAANTFASVIPKYYGCFIFC